MSGTVSMFGAAGGAGGTINGNTVATNCWSYQPGYYNYTPVYDMTVRKVANGFIVNKSGKEYVFNSTDGIANFIAKEFKEKK